MNLKIVYDATHEVWFAYEAETPEDSHAIGQGTSPEAACTDYWYQRKGDAADLPHDEESGWWRLSQGCWTRLFLSKEEAIQYADEHNWQAK